MIFKEIFGTKKNIRFLEVFLEELKKLPRNSLKDKVTILNGNPLNKTNVKNKSVASDILVEIPGEIINLEMYTSSFDEEDFTKSKVYFFRIYSTDLPVGEKYQKQHKVSQYNICLKSSLSFTKNLKTEYLLKEKEKNVIVAEDLKGYIYNLDKLDEVTYNVGESNLLNRIFKIIKATTDEERESIAEGSEILMDIVTQIRKFLYDEETKEMKNIQDKWKYEARKEGRTEGLAEGIEQGQLNIIYNMIQEHEKPEKIAKYTGYSVSKIKEIQKELSAKM